MSSQEFSYKPTGIHGDAKRAYMPELYQPQSTSSTSTDDLLCTFAERDSSNSSVLYTDSFHRGVRKTPDYAVKFYCF